MFGKVYVLLKVPITYIMLNLTGRVRGHCITYNRFYIYINKSDSMTDLKGSEGPRIVVMYRDNL